MSTASGSDWLEGAGAVIPAHRSADRLRFVRSQQKGSVLFRALAGRMSRWLGKYRRILGKKQDGFQRLRCAATLVACKSAEGRIR